MQAMELQRVGAKPGFGMAERSMPRPGPHEIVVRMRAAALNNRDWQVATGTYHMPIAPPLVPLSDGVGEVTAIGENVREHAVGDRVAGTFFQSWDASDDPEMDPGSTLGGPLDGMLAEYVLLRERGAIKVPAYLSDEEAATLPCAGVTAFRALVQDGRLQRGQTVLVQGSGGVSVFAVQIASALGARAIVLSRSASKLDKLRALGASLCLDASSDDWVERVLAATDGRGVDHIVDVAGPGSFAQTLRALRPGGQVSVIGYLGGVQGSINPLQLLERQAVVRGLQVGSRQCFRSLNHCLETHHWRPVIDKVFGWTELDAALQRLVSMQHVGKLVLRF